MHPLLLSLSLIANPCAMVFAKEQATNTTTKRSGIELYSLAQRQDSFDACQHVFPNQDPETTIQPTYVNQQKWGLRRLCSNDFAVLYSDTSKTPLLVTEKLNAKGLILSIKRSDDFFADTRTPSKQRATLADYKNLTNIDRGHLAPAGDAVSAMGMAQTFALSNMVPQDSNNNRNAWKKIENDVRKYVMRSQGEVYVITGVLFDGKTTKVGKTQIWKPSHLFKVVYHPQQNKSWAYVIKNQANQAIYQISYDEFSKKTGVKLGFLEQGFQAQQSTAGSILSGVASAVVVQQATEMVSENLDKVSPNVDGVWSGIKQKMHALWTSLLQTIVGWLKDHDKNEK